MTDKFFSIGINPVAIGTSGIIIKTYNGFYPQKLMINIESNNSINAADSIIDWIENKRKKLEQQDFYLKEVVVGIPDDAENFKEIKATDELVGILKHFYRTKFKGHLPDHKSKKLLDSWNSDKRTSQVKNAEAILFAHIDELKTGFKCENAWGYRNVIEKHRN